MDSITSRRVRPLSLDELGVPVLATAQAATMAEPAEVVPLPDTDDVLVKVRAALSMGFAGVILSGPPGTGKSWYAKRIAHTIAGDTEAVRIVQFHTSYQYEDFMEGFAPLDSGEFELQSKLFCLLCREAQQFPDVKHVLLIDEISRCDVARVFGEALTYIEMDKRGLEFMLASGRTLVVPSNLVIIATMNPWDRGVDELDVALERRFAQIDMPPRVDKLRNMLSKKGADAALIDRVARFFEYVQGLDDEMVHLGHAYFRSCVDDMTARRTWDFLLYPFFKKACRLDRDMLEEISRMWHRSFPPSTAEVPAGTGEPESGVVAEDQEARTSETS